MFEAENHLVLLGIDLTNRRPPAHSQLPQFARNSLARQSRLLTDFGTGSSWNEEHLELIQRVSESLLASGQHQDSLAYIKSTSYLARMADMNEHNRAARLMYLAALETGAGDTDAAASRLIITETMPIVHQSNIELMTLNERWAQLLTSIGDHDGAEHHHRSVKLLREIEQLPADR